MTPETHENKSFKDFYLSDEVKQGLDEINYVTPTPVQASSIPLIMAGIDIIVQSQTGTGKTAAFGIPVIEMLEHDPGLIEVLALAPTRELAKQVSDEFERLARFKDISSTAIYGGASYGPQLEALKTAQMVCATPGRLLDLLKQGELSLDHLRFFILDEADEMLSMGFERELNAILEFLPEERQSLLFSATVTEDVKSLAQNMLFHPEYLSFSSDSVVNTDVEHSYIRVNGVARMRDLIKIIEFHDPEAALVFANTKNDTFLVSNFLRRHNYRAEVLNGDLPQSEREKTLKQLRDGKIDYIVATDVAARGIDITDLSHVINYVLPENPDVYVHRTGRTGRAGKKGKAISLVSPAEMASFILIERNADLELNEEPMPTTHDIVRAKGGRITSGFERRLRQFNKLPFASKLPMAERIIEGTDDATPEDRTRLVAKLLALADWAIASDGSLEVAPIAQIEAKQRAAAAPAPPSPAEEVEEVTEEVVAEEVEATPEPAKPEPQKKPERRSSRSASKREQQKEAPKPEPTPAPTPSSDAPSIADLLADDDDHDMQRMWMNIGRNVFSGDDEALDFVTFASGMDRSDFGEIRIERSHSFVEVRKDYFRDVVDAINDMEWEGNKVQASRARSSR